MNLPSDIPFRQHAPIPTWFEVGGPARYMAEPRTGEQLARLVRIAPDLLVLGDGANLLVDDAGVENLVVRLTSGDFAQCDIDADGLVRAGAGVHLFKLINTTVGAGLQGLEVLAGVPATLGGALAMNAGGTYGSISDVVRRVFALDRDGREVVLEKEQVGFGYRSGGLLKGLVITGAELRLTPDNPVRVQERKQQINELKKKSQPLNANSAGCCFKNPTLAESLDGIGVRGQRVSAGLVIDRAGLKGLRVGAATVSDQHANFIVVDKDRARARDVIALMLLVQTKVFERFGVRLEREVVVWSGEDQPRITRALSTLHNVSP